MPAWATSAVRVAASSTRPGAIRPADLATERLGDPAIRLALLAGRPEAATQRHDRDGNRRRRLLERVGHGQDGRAVPDPDRRAGPHGDAQDLRREPADHPAGEVLGSGDGRCEVDLVERVAVPGAPPRPGCRLRSWSTIRISTIPSARARLSSRDTCGRVTPEELGDLVLRLAQLVVQAAGAHELLEVAHRGVAGRRVRLVRSRFARLYLSDVHPCPGIIPAAAWGCQARRAATGGRWSFGSTPPCVGAATLRQCRPAGRAPATRTRQGRPPAGRGT